MCTFQCPDSNCLLDRLSVLTSYLSTNQITGFINNFQSNQSKAYTSQNITNCFDRSTHISEFSQSNVYTSQSITNCFDQSTLSKYTSEFNQSNAYTSQNITTQFDQSALSTYTYSNSTNQRELRKAPDSGIDHSERAPKGSGF